MAELLNYVGNAGLGLGSNPDINVGGTNLNVLNGTMRDIMLLDNENNIKLFNQKVSDRDKLTNLILNNQISTGEISPEDQKYFDKAKDGVEKAYTDWGGNMNDIAGVRKYQAAVTSLQDTATHAQTRWAGIKKLQVEQSQQTLPSKIKNYQDWIDTQKSKPFGSQIVPYQQLHDFSIDDILSGVTPDVSATTDPKTGFIRTTSTVNYADILKNKQNDYINDRDKADSIDQFTDKLARYTQPQLQKAISATDSQIDLYNQQRGFTEGQPGYVDHVKVQKNDDGTILLAEPKTSLAAKWALANQKDFVTSTLGFNKDIGKNLYDKGRLGLLHERNVISAKKLNIEATKADAYARNLDAKTKQVLEAADKEGTDITGEYNSFVDHISPGSIAIRGGADQKIGSLDAIYLNDLPGGFQYINGPVVDAKGKITAGKLQPFVTSNKVRYPIDPLTKKEDKTQAPIPAGNPYYIPQYIDPRTGENLNLNKLPSDIQQGLDIAKKSGYTAQDFIKALLKSGKLELQLKGKNGTANYTSLAQSAKIINNAASKKGQENVMNPPESAPDEPTEPEETPAAPENPEHN